MDTNIHSLIQSQRITDDNVYKVYARIIRQTQSMCKSTQIYLGTSKAIK